MTEREVTSAITDSRGREVSATMDRSAREAESMKRTRCRHSAAFNVEVALAAVKGDQRLTSLAERLDVHSNQITQWKSELLIRAAEVFATLPTCARLARTSRRCNRRLRSKLEEAIARHGRPAAAGRE